MRIDIYSKSYGSNSILIKHTATFGNHNPKVAVPIVGNQVGKTTEQLASGSASESAAINEGVAGGEVSRYNGFNQLVETTLDDVTASYAYAPSGLRISKTVGGTTTKFVLDGSNVALEMQGSGVTGRYVRGFDLVQSTIGGETSYYLYNGHGDVVQLANASGAVTKTYDYDAFGNEKTPDTTDANPFRYSGEYYDTETGTYYLRARYYDPTTGRLITEDPIRDGLNYYTYCSNNPVAFIDPWGLADISIRSTIEGLEGSVAWNDRSKTAIVYLDGQSVVVYAGDKNGSYIDENSRMHTDDAWLFMALGSSFDLGKGWTGRIERHGSGSGFQRHVVLIDKHGIEHAQNEDGSPHDKGGSPPNSIKKELKKSRGWDWDQKDNDWINKIEMYQDLEGYTYINYPNGRSVTVYNPESYYSIPYYPSNQNLRDYYYGSTKIDLSGGSAVTNPSVPFVPMPNPAPIPIPAPMPMPIFS